MRCPGGLTPRRQFRESFAYLAPSAIRYRYSFGMPGQRRTTGQRASGSRLARLAGIGVAVLIAAGAVAAYLVALHPARHPPPPLPTKVLSSQTVGLIARVAQPGSSSGQLLQLLGPAGAPQFSPVGQAEEQSGSPRWTADLMAGNSYIFIYLPTGHCLAAAGRAGQQKLTLEHCDLAAQQRWRRTRAAVQIQGHDFYQYANLADGSCLTETAELSGPAHGAALQGCAAVPPSGQLIGFWWASV
jgi:hypothetical protein